MRSPRAGHSCAARGLVIQNLIPFLNVCVSPTHRITIWRQCSGPTSGRQPPCGTIRRRHPRSWWRVGQVLTHWTAYLFCLILSIHSHANMQKTSPRGRCSHRCPPRDTLDSALDDPVASVLPLERGTVPCRSEVGSARSLTAPPASPEMTPGGCHAATDAVRRDGVRRTDEAR